jgi:hypothetical protein
MIDELSVLLLNQLKLVNKNAGENQNIKA